MRKITLNDDWKLWQANGEETNGRVFSVETLPCQVEDVLIREGIVEDPNLHGINEDRWIGQSDWCYEKHFVLEDTDGSWNLVLEGLDTFADIWLNGRKLAQNESVYMPCRIENVEGLRRGANVLRLEFRSPWPILEQITLPGEQEELVPAFCRARGGRILSTMPGRRGAVLPAVSGRGIGGGRKTALLGDFGNLGSGGGFSCALVAQDPWGSAAL